MTCKTCHGRKVVKHIVRTEALRSLLTTDQAQSMSEAVDAPCPDCTPKPFAFMAPDPMTTGNEWEALYVAGIRLASHRPAYGGALPEICDDINAAVEQREAKLRAACMLAAERIAREAYEYHNRPDVDQREGYGEGARAIALRIAERIRTLEPNVANYVPAAQYAELRKHIEGTWGVLLEQLSETPDALPFALACAKELGIKLDAPIAAQQGAKLHITGPDLRRIDFIVNKVEVIDNGHDVVEVRLWGVGKRTPQARTAARQAAGTFTSNSDGSATLALPQTRPPGPPDPPPASPGRKHG